MFSARKREYKSAKALEAVRKRIEMIIIWGKVLKFEFRKSDKMRINRIISSPETREKKSATTFKTVRK